MQVTMIGDFWLERDVSPPDNSDNCCPDCGTRIGYRAKRCHTHANQESAKRRTASREAKKMVRRCLDIHRARQNAEQTIVTMGQKLEREVGRAEREVRG